jgi:DNA-binding transcriptional ArsR family regulator
MSPFPATIEQPVRERVQIELDPVRNAIASMMLVTKWNEIPSTHPWVTQTQAKLSSGELFTHQLVILGFFHAIQPQTEWETFYEYLRDLEESEPEVLRDRMLDAYGKVCINCDMEETKNLVNWDEILGSADTYVDFLMQRFGEDLVDVELETKAYEYVINPPALKELVTSHLRWFWEMHLSAEFARMQPILKESIKAFQDTDFSGMSKLEAARYITGQDLDEESWQKMSKEFDQFLFIPNPHIGPYVTRLHCDEKLAIIFGARQPENASVRIPEFDRADIVARMSAIADDTRLRILQMISEGGEMRSQDIIEAIGLSQPSVSRYLKQLTVTGYLQERRDNGAKAYTINRDRIEKTLKAVHKFLLGN